MHRRTEVPDDADAGGAGQDDAGADGRPAPTGTGALPWVLVAAAAAPVLLAGEASRQFFSGARDEQYFGYYGASGDLVGDPSVSLLDRWSTFGYAVPAVPALLASALGIAVVTGLVLLDRPRWLVPGTAARWAACGVAAATAAASALLLLLALLVVSEDVDTDAQGGVTYVPQFTEVAGPVGVALLAGVLTAMAAVVLARPPRRPGPAAGTPGAEAAGAADGGHHDVERVVAGQVAADHPVADRIAADQGAGRPAVTEQPTSSPPRTAGGDPAPAVLPHPTAADLELYRRR